MHFLVGQRGCSCSLCFRIYPQLKVVFSRPDRRTLQKLWNYSFYAFLINVAIQVAYYTDNLVVGAFLSPSAVTLYAIGGLAHRLRAANRVFDDHHLHSAGQHIRGGRAITTTCGGW